MVTLTLTTKDWLIHMICATRTIAVFIADRNCSLYVAGSENATVDNTIHTFRSD